MSNSSQDPQETPTSSEVAESTSSAQSDSASDAAEPFDLSDAASGLGTRLLVWLIVLVGFSVVAAIISALVPRWWAQRIADMVDGQLLTGTFLGLTVGFVFTLLPLMILPSALVWRSRSLGARFTALVIALVAALPNLTTLIIARGTSNAAHAGQRILDVDGPGFRQASALGAAAAVVVFLVIRFFLWRHRRRTKEIVELRSEVSVRDAVSRLAATSSESGAADAKNSPVIKGETLPDSQ